MLSPGDKLPIFQAKDHTNNLISSQSFIGNQHTIIYFYPKNFTAGCTAEACSFRDNIQDFSQYNARVVGISGDSPDSHKKFAESYQLPFTLLSDEDRKIRELFGVEKVMGFLENRVTFIFDKNGILKQRFSSQIFPTKHIKQALEILAEIEEKSK